MGERFGTEGGDAGIDWSAQSIYLNSLVDVNIPEPTDGLVLTYNGATGKWVAQVAGAGSDTKTEVYEAGVQVGSVARAINFDGTDFNITEDAGNDWFLIEAVAAGMSVHDMTGAYHTEDATGGVGNVIRATGATAFAWAQLQHADIGGVTSDLHHPQSHALSGGDHTGDLVYTQVDDIVDITGTGANNLLSRADHVHTDSDGSSKITYSDLSSIPSTFDPDSHDLTSAYHTDSGLTIGHFLKATGTTTFAWGVHGLGASDVGAYTTAQVDSAIDTDITTHAGLGDAHHSQSHVLSGGDHTASGLTIGHALIADSTTAFSWQVPSYYNSFTTDFAAESLANLTTRTHASLSDAPTDAHHTEAHAMPSSGPHTATGLTVGWVLSADSATTFSWKAPTGGADPNAIHDNTADEIHQITLKGTPVSADELVIEDSVAGWVKKRVTISSLPAGSPSFGSPTGGIDIGDSAVEGSSGDSTRADHQHAFTAPSASYPLDTANTESDGVATTPARSDHVHALGAHIHTATAGEGGTLTWANTLAVAAAGSHDHSDNTKGDAVPEASITFSATGHDHDGTGSENVDYTNLDSIPSSFTPAAHVLATTGPHTGTLPLTDLAVGSQGSVIRRGAADWEELGIGTLNYALVCTATDAVWAQYDYTWLASIPSTFDPTSHGSSAHTGAVFAGANDDFGAFYLDIDDIAVPVDPAVSVRRLFVDTATGKLSVRTNASTTISLEEQGGGVTWASPTGAIDIGDAETEGVSTDAARSDHQHAFTAPSASYPVQVDIGDAQVDGVATTPARSDHGHAFPAPGAGYPQDIAAAESDGVATTPARSDHVHAHPSALGTDLHHNEAHVLATTGPHTGTLPVADITNGTQYQYLRAGGANPEWQARTFTVSATIKSPEVGYTTVWRAPIGCTCTKLEGRQKSGTSTVINARYNGTTDVMTADLTLTTADTWYSSTGVNQTAWSATDWLEIEVQALGSATEITYVLTFTEP
jgi:hypothetical protein